MSKKNVADVQSASQSITVTAKEGSKTAKILEAYAKDPNVGRVAKELKMKYQHVYNALRMKGIQPSSNRQPGNSLTSKMIKLRDEGKTTGEIAKILSKEEGREISYQQVYNSLKGNINKSESGDDMSFEIQLDQLEKDAEEQEPDLEEAEA